MEALKAQRSCKWDILKFILIFLVVLGHGVDYFTGASEFMRSLFIFIYTFHIPVFIFVSGLFAKNTVNQKRYDKMLGYLLLYFVIKLYPFLYRNLTGGKSGINLWVESGIPWFMFALFAFYLTTVALRRLPSGAVLAVSVILGCAAGYFSFIGDFLVLSRIIVYYPFFFLGYCFDRDKVESFCAERKHKIAAAAVIIVFLVIVFTKIGSIYWLRPLLTGRNPFSALGAYKDFGFLIRIVYYAVVFLVGGSVVVITPNKTPFGICERLGQRTLAVYGLHYVVFYLLYEKFGLASDMSGQWLVLPVSVAATLFFSLEIFNKAFLFLLNLPGKIINLAAKKEKC